MKQRRSSHTAERSSSDDENEPGAGFDPVEAISSSDPRTVLTASAGAAACALLTMRGRRDVADALSRCVRAHLAGNPFDLGDLGTLQRYVKDEAGVVARGISGLLTARAARIAARVERSRREGGRSRRSAAQRGGAAR